MANRPYMLQYDIPAPGGVAVMDNPSGLLYAAGCLRTTGSVWVVMEANLNTGRMMRLLNRFDARGVKWFTVPFDVSGMETLRAMVTHTLRTEIAELTRSAEASRAEADARLDDESEANYAARRRVYLSAARVMETRVRRLELMALAASQFGVDVRNVNEAAGSVDAMAYNMRARAKAFAEAHGILTRSRASGAAGMARSLDAGEVHPAIAADFLSDLDEEKAADGLRSTFGII